jgi:hypothetical protein
LIPHFINHTPGTARNGADGLASANPRLSAPSPATAGEPGTISPGDAARLGFVPTSIHERGRFTAASGKPFGLYVGKRSDTGKQCIILVGGGSTGGACDPTLFTNGPIAFVEAASGGPAKSDRTDFEVAGVVADSVARLDIVDSLDRVTRINTSGANKAFFFELKPSDLARGVGINSLIARDAGGAVLATNDVSEPGR